MSEPQVINTLRTKANQLEAHIAKLERDMDRARKDLAHVRASIVLFEAPRLNGQPAYITSTRCSGVANSQGYARWRWLMAR